MPRHTKEVALATRTRIIDAAELVFHEKGVAHASLEEIAAAADVTRGAIYWHFKDKAQLFDAMMERVRLPVEAITEGADRDAKADPLALLRHTAIDVLLRTARCTKTQRVFDIAYHKCEYVGDAAGVRDRHVASQRECLGTIEEGFRACVKVGQLPGSVDPKVAAIGAMSLVSGLIANWVLAPRSFSLEKHAETLVDIYFRGLAQDSPRRGAALPLKTGNTEARRKRRRKPS